MAREKKRELDIAEPDMPTEVPGNEEPPPVGDKKGRPGDSYEPPADAVDLGDVYEDQGEQDDITNETGKVALISKPRGFFMVSPRAEYRRRLSVYTHSVEGKVGKMLYVVTKKMAKEMPEAQPCAIVVVVNRLLVPSLWPLKRLDDDGNDYDSWKQQRLIAKKSMTWWLRFVKWTGSGYLTREAPKGYAPIPDWDALPPFDELMARAVGPTGIIRDRDHPIYKDVMGLDQKVDSPDDDDDDL
jgi:hypothetical protein